MTLQHPHADLSAYIDDALDPAAQAAVAEHVAACTVCRAHVAQLRATANLLQALPDPVPSRRLVPRLAGSAGPAWLAPLRTVMTLASGTAVFLFIASALVTNINFLASGAPTALTASGGARETTANADGQAAARPASSQAPAPATSPNAAFAASSTAPQGTGAKASTDSAPSDAAKLQDQASGAPVAPGAATGQDLARTAASEPQRSPLLNPWLWLTLAILCAASAIVIQRRLHASI
ncbi:MAG: zf-HC2 domain-containing protein [Chloroflexota bacterium]